MIRFNWRKLKDYFRPRARGTRQLNALRPWWLQIGCVYYVAGNSSTRWILSGFDKSDPRAVIVTCANFGRGTETVHADSILQHPQPMLRSAP